MRQQKTVIVCGMELPMPGQPPTGYLDATARWAHDALVAGAKNPQPDKRWKRNIRLIAELDGTYTIQYPESE